MFAETVKPISFPTTSFLTQTIPRITFMLDKKFKVIIGNGEPILHEFTLFLQLGMVSLLINQIKASTMFFLIWREGDEPVVIESIVILAYPGRVKGMGCDTVCFVK
jgi:hypothetical protein